MNGFYWIKYSGPVELALRLKAMQTVEAAHNRFPSRAIS
jgi:hypothetical protein